MTNAYIENRTDAQVVEQGIATYVSSSGITDANKLWAPGQWAGHLVRFRGSQTSPNDHAVGVIASNGIMDLVLASGLSLTFETLLQYEILAIRAAGGEESVQRGILMALQLQNALLRQLRDGLSVSTGIDFIAVSKPDPEEI